MAPTDPTSASFSLALFPRLRSHPAGSYPGRLLILCLVANTYSFSRPYCPVPVEELPPAGAGDLVVAHGGRSSSPSEYLSCHRRGPFQGWEQGQVLPLDWLSLQETRMSNCRPPLCPSQDHPQPRGENTLRRQMQGAGEGSLRPGARVTGRKADSHLHYTQIHLSVSSSHRLYYCLASSTVLLPRLIDCITASPHRLYRLIDCTTTSTCNISASTLYLTEADGETSRGGCVDTMRRTEEPRASLASCHRRMLGH
jgi:hypothetical protein